MLHVPGYTLRSVLAQGEESRVYAGTRDADAAPIIAKIALAGRDLAVEHELIQRVAGDGIVEVLGLVDRAEGRILLQKRFGDGTLATALRAGPFAVARVLRVGLRLASILARVHAARVINRDIKPANILFDSTSDAILLADFGVSAELPVGARRLPVVDFIGTPAYMSPEQTGRTREGADARSDLYSFGVVLYEALTGKVPFESRDTLELLAAHLSRVPDAPAQRVRSIPPVLSALVMKLLAKQPDERYQTASGVAADLKRCLDTLTGDGRIAEFPLGENDAVSLRFPSRLFGRADELASLTAGLARARTGQPTLILVSGAKGAGHAELVRAFARSATPPVLWATGTFGGPSDRPLAAVSDALAELVGRLLLLDDTALAALRQRLHSHLGSIGGVLTEIEPAFVDLLGPQEPLPTLGAAESRMRFQLAFRRLFAALGEEGGFVLSLDRFERADASSRALIDALLSAADTGQLLLVLCASVKSAFEGLAERADTDLELGPLPLATTSAWLHEVLQCDTAAAEPLAELLYQRSQGNIDFIEPLLEHLREASVLQRSQGRWTWSLDSVRDAPPLPSLGTLAATRVGELPEERRHVLEAMACHTEPVEAATVALMLSAPAESCAELLAALAREGLVVKVAAGYTVAHPAIGEVALAGTPLAQQRTYNTRLAQHLLATLSDAELAAQAYRVAATLQRGNPPAAASECERAARCFLAAAELSIRATAYDVARQFFQAGLELLGASRWNSQRTLTFALELGQARTLAVLGQTAEAEAEFDTLCARELSPPELAAAYGGRTDNFQGVMDRERAVEAGLAGLRRLGLNLPKRPSELRPLPALLKNQYHLAKLTTADILARPPCVDEHANAVGYLIGQMIAPAFFFDPNLFVLLNEVALSYYLKYGHTNAAVFLLGSHSMVLNGALKKYDAAYALVEALDALIEKRNAPEFVAKALVTSYHFTAPLYRGWRELAAGLGDGVLRGLETGDAIFAAYCAVCELNILCLAGAPLAQIHERCKTHAQSGGRGEGAVLSYMKLVGNIAEKLLAGEPLDGATDLDPVFAVNRAAGSIRNEAMTMTGFAVVAAGHEKTVRAWMADITKDYEKVCFAAPTKLDLWQLEGYFACRDARAGDKRALRIAHNRLEKIKTLQAETRAPIQPRRLFLEADIARAQGEVAKASDLYGLAAAVALKHEYHQIAAFALEGRAELLKAAGRADEAAVFYKEAALAYRRWGHMLKARELETPEARAAGAGLLPTVTAGGTKHSRTNQSTHNDALNLGTVLKVSQQISTQLHAAGVVQAVLSGVAENAGAARAVLVLGAVDGGDRVYAELEHGTYRELDVALEAYLQLPKSLLRVVRRNGKAVVLADAAGDATFGADPFVRDAKCRSLACIPLTRRGDWAGCVVLENRFVAGAFTSNLLEIAQPLLTQAAISLDNAALYADMEARVRERTAALDTRNRQMRIVLDNVAQGLIATDREGRLGAERSAVVERWFDRGVPDTLGELFAQYSPENKPWLDATWDQLHEGFMPIELTCDQLPKLMRVADRELDVTWQPISDATGTFARMLIVMSDVTELRRQQRGEQEQRESLALLERLTRDREGVIEFIKETSAMITELRLARSSREVDKRLVHTLKGNLGLFGLSSISTLCHDIETAMAEGQRELSSDERATLAAAWEKMVERFQRYLSFEDELLQVYRQDYESALRVLRRDAHPLLHDLELWTLEPLKARLARIGEQAKAIAERLGKGPLQIRIEHAGIRLDAGQWARFWSSFVHAVRNAIDHGIETPEERAAQGKGRATLRLSAHIVGDELVLECADDGRGVNWEKIREKAQSAGLPAETAEDLTQALFSDGISTRDQVSDMSGRGVGMAALAEACTAMSGKITVLSERGAGTTFRFTFPSAQAHVLRELWASIPPAAE